MADTRHSIVMSKGYRSYAFKCYYVKAWCRCGALVHGPVDLIAQKWAEHIDGDAHGLL